MINSDTKGNAMRLRYLILIPLALASGCRENTARESHTAQNTPAVINTPQTTIFQCSEYTGPILPGDEYRSGLWIRDGKVFGFAEYEDSAITTCANPDLPVCYWEGDEAIQFTHAGAVAPPADSERTYCPGG